GPWRGGGGRRLPPKIPPPPSSISSPVPGREGRRGFFQELLASLRWDRRRVLRRFGGGDRDGPCCLELGRASRSPLQSPSRKNFLGANAATSSSAPDLDRKSTRLNSSH